MMFFPSLIPAEVYKQMAVHPGLKSQLQNPFMIDSLGGAGCCFFPWPDSAFIAGVWLFLVAALLFWFSSRINTALIFRLLAWNVLGLSLSTFMFYRSPFPHPGGDFITIWLLIALYVFMVVITAVLAVQQLPYFNVPERFLTNLQTGAVTPYTMWGAALAVFAVGFFAMGGMRAYIFAMLCHNLITTVIVMILVVILGGVLGKMILPWEELTQYPILGGGYMKALAPIFALNGPASRVEIISVGIGVCATYICISLVSYGSISGTDILSLLLIGTISFAALRAEMAKAAKTEESIVVERHKDAWS